MESSDKNLKESIQNLGKYEDKLQKIVGLEATQAKQLKDMEETMRSSIEKYAEINQSYIERENVVKRIANLEEQNKNDIGVAQDEQEKNLAEIRKLTKDKLELDKLLTEEYGDQREILANQIESQEKTAELLKKEIEDNKVLAKIQEEAAGHRKEALDKFETATNSILQKTLGLSAAWKDTFLGSLTTVRQMGLGTEAMDRFKGSMKDAASNMAPSMLEKIAESTIMVAKSQDEARASFVATTGQMDTQIVSAMAIQRQYAFAGVSVQSFGSAFTNLSNTFVSFNKLSTEQQGELAANVAMLETLGVASQSVADTHANLGLRLGMTTEQSQAQVREFVALSGAGISAAQAVEGFNQSLPNLIEFGKKSVDIYKKLIVASKELNIDTGELLSTMSQFDTFETAADAVGRLNAVLGGSSLNSIDFLDSDPEEKIRMLIRAREESGKTWEQMGRFEQKALASAAGISDMNTATAIFSQTLTGYDAAQRKANDASLSPEELKRRAALTQTLADDFKSIMESLAISFAPVISHLKDFTAWFAEADVYVSKMTGGLAGLGTILATILGVVGIALTIAMGKFTTTVIANTVSLVANTIASTSAAAAGATLATTTTAAGASASVALPALLGLAAAGLGIGLGIGAAAYGLAALADSFAALNPGQMAAVEMVLGSIAAGMGILVAIAIAGGPAAALAIASIGLAAMAMGAGIGLAALGLAEFAKAIGSIESDKFEQMGDLAIKMIAVGIGAPLIVGAAVAISAIAVSFGLLGLAMKTMDTTALESMATILDSITKITPEIAVRFVSVTDGLNSVMNTADTVAQDGAPDVINSIKNKISGGGGSGQGSSQTLNISLELDKKVIQNIVVDVINGSASVRKNN